MSMDPTMRNAMAGEDGAERTQACLLFAFVGRCVEGFGKCPNQWGKRKGWRLHKTLNLLAEVPRFKLEKDLNLLLLVRLSLAHIGSPNLFEDRSSSPSSKHLRTLNKNLHYLVKNRAITNCFSMIPMTTKLPAYLVLGQGSKYWNFMNWPPGSVPTWRICGRVVESKVPSVATSWLKES